MNKITDKTHCLVTRNLGKIWLTENQANQVKQMIVTGKQAIVIGSDVIMQNDIAGLVSGDRIAELDHEKRGEWKCKYNQWHAKGEQCGHDGKHN